MQVKLTEAEMVKLIQSGGTGELAFGPGGVWINWDEDLPMPENLCKVLAMQRRGWDMTVAELLADESSWTPASIARDAKGCAVADSSPLACQWCVVGALIKVYPEIGEQIDAWNKLAKIVGGQHMAAWNDRRGRTHAEVLEAVRKAGI